MPYLVATALGQKAMTDTGGGVEVTIDFREPDGSLS